MGAYIASSDIKLPSGLKTYLDGDASATDAAILTAESEADSYLAKAGNKVPLSRANITPFLKQCVIQLALYYVYVNRQQFVPEDIKDGYLISVKNLNGMYLDTDNRDKNSETGDRSVETNRG